MRDSLLLTFTVVTFEIQDVLISVGIAKPLDPTAVFLAVHIGVFSSTLGSVKMLSPLDPTTVSHTVYNRAFASELFSVRKTTPKDPMAVRFAVYIRAFSRAFKSVGRAIMSGPIALHLSIDKCSGQVEGLTPSVTWLKVIFQRAPSIGCIVLADTGPCKLSLTVREFGSRQEEIAFLVVGNCLPASRLVGWEFVQAATLREVKYPVPRAGRFRHLFLKRRFVRLRNLRIGIFVVRFGCLTHCAERLRLIPREKACRLQSLRVLPVPDCRPSLGAEQTVGGAGIEAKRGETLLYLDALLARHGRVLRRSFLGCGSGGVQGHNRERGQRKPARCKRCDYRFHGQTPCSMVKYVAFRRPGRQSSLGASSLVGFIVT